MSGTPTARNTGASLALCVLALAVLVFALASPPAIAQDASPGLVSPAEFGAELPFGYKAVRYAILDSEIRVTRPDLPIEIQPFPDLPAASNAAPSQGRSVDLGAVKAAGVSPQVSSPGGIALPTPGPASAAVLARPEPRTIRLQLVRLIEQLRITQATR